MKLTAARRDQVLVLFVEIVAHRGSTQLDLITETGLTRALAG